MTEKPHHKTNTDHSETRLNPLLRLAFRPFFLLGAFFSCVSLLVWSALFNGSIQFEVFGGSYWWHIHEMLFGFASAIIAGFLLTAVQTWSGLPGIKGIPLLFLIAVWVAARIGFMLPHLIPHSFISFIDLIFLPLVAVFLAIPIIKVKLWHNAIFIPLLLAMTFANATLHCAKYIQESRYIIAASDSMILLITLLMCVIGGRVFPMFTANGTKTERVATIPWLEKISLGLALLIVIQSFNVLTLADPIKASLFIFAAFFHSLRAFRWRIWVTLKTPLVWSLHLSYWCIPLGFLLYGLHMLGIVSHSQAVHTITIGAMGTMILSMISRVSLGHTGRPIIVGKTMGFAFIAIYLAFIIRVIGGNIFSDYTHVIFISTLLWCVAYGCFLYKYLPILSKPRIDGKAG